MRETDAKLRSRLPAAKCLPPDIELSRHVPRPRLTDALRRAWSQHRVLLIDGPPGQGKTVLGAQLVDDLADWAWLNVGPEDREPGVLVYALARCLAGVLPELDIQPTIRILEDDPTHGEDAALNLLLGALAADGRTVHLCIDRVDQLEPHETATERLARAAASAPPNLRLLLIGRSTPTLIEQRLDAFARHHLPPPNLDMTEAETAMLCQNLLALEMPLHLLRSVQRVTLGWPLGVRFYAEALAHWRIVHPENWPAALDDARPEPLDRFFEGFYREQPERRRRLLAAIAWLDSDDPQLVEAALAESLAPQELSGLVRERLFLREGALRGWRMHPLFRAFLRSGGDGYLAPDGTRALLQRAAAHQMKHGRLIDALHYALLGGELDAAETWIEAHAAELLAERHKPRTHALLGQLPSERLRRNPQLALVRGAVLLQHEPAAAAQDLAYAADRLRRSGAETAELLALAYLIEYHLTVDGLIARIPDLLARAEELYTRHRDDLAAQLELMVCVRLGAAATYGLLDSAKNRQYFEKALQLAQRAGTVNEEVQVRCVRIFDQLRQDDLTNAAAQLEQLRPHLGDPELSELGRLLIRSASCDLLHATGAFTACQREVDRIQRLDPEIFVRGVRGPAVLRAQAEQALAVGDDAGALQHVERAFSHGHAALSAHMKSELLQYRAYALARLGRHEQARADIEESQALRRSAGGPDYSAVNHLFVGATYRELGEWPRAEHEFGKAIEISETIRPALAAGAYAHRALGYLAQGAVSQAVYDTAAFLRRFRQQQSRYCAGWVPDVMEQVLGFAISCDIERDYATELAERLLGVFFDEQGRVLPVLRLYTLGRFELQLGSQRISGAELTPRAQQYLGTLAATPNCELSREMLQETIWPEAGENSSKLYALRNRIKGLVAGGRSGQDAERYFVLRASIARLEHAWVDAHAFERHVQAGLAHWRRGDRWQAAVAFREAQAFWQGPFCATTATTDLIREYRNQLDRLNEQRVLHWSDVLIGNHQDDDAIEVLSEYFYSDPANLEVAARLARLQQRSGRNAALRRTMAQCQRALQEEGYDDAELRDLLDTLLAD